MCPVDIYIYIKIIPICWRNVLISLPSGKACAQTAPTLSFICLCPRPFASVWPWRLFGPVDWNSSSMKKGTPKTTLEVSFYVVVIFFPSAVKPHRYHCSEQSGFIDKIHARQKSSHVSSRNFLQMSFETRQNSILFYIHHPFLSSVPVASLFCLIIAAHFFSESLYSSSSTTRLACRYSSWIYNDGGWPLITSLLLWCFFPPSPELPLQVRSAELTLS